MRRGNFESISSKKVTTTEILSSVNVSRRRNQTENLKARNAAWISALTSVQKAKWLIDVCFSDCS